MATKISGVSEKSAYQMKIGIITFEFNYNYGAVLQATALSDFLTDLGHDVRIINRGWGELPPPSAQ